MFWIRKVCWFKHFNGILPFCTKTRNNCTCHYLLVISISLVLDTGLGIILFCNVEPQLKLKLFSLIFIVIFAFHKSIVGSICESCMLDICVKCVFIIFFFSEKHNVPYHFDFSTNQFLVILRVHSLNSWLLLLFYGFEWKPHVRNNVTTNRQITWLSLHLLSGPRKAICKIFNPKCAVVVN